MSPRLVDRLGLGNRELVAIVGAGGKSTILARIGREWAASGAAVIVTTTTKMGADQATEPSVFSSDPRAIIDAVEPGTSLFVAAARDEEKVTGLTPDGSRHQRNIKLLSRGLQGKAAGDIVQAVHQHLGLANEAGGILIVQIVAMGPYLSGPVDGLYPPDGYGRLGIPKICFGAQGLAVEVMVAEVVTVH